MSDLDQTTLDDSVTSFIDTARRLSERLRTDRHAPSGSDLVRVHDGTWPLCVVTERSDYNCSADVRLHRHLTWQPSLQIQVFSNGSAPNAIDLGTGTVAGSADLLDLIVRCVEDRADHARGYDLLQTAADVVGALIGPSSSTIIVHAPTRWSALKIVRADGGDVEVPAEASGLLSAVPEMMQPTFWMQAAREDVPPHPRVSLRGRSVVPRPTDPLTVVTMLREHPSTYANA